MIETHVHRESSKEMLKETSGISYSNIFYMLLYNQNIYDKLIESKKDKEIFEDIQSLLDFSADILIEKLKEMVELGLLKRFNSHMIQTERPRGMIDIQKSISAGAFGKFELVCKINQMDPNTRCNQVIKTAINSLLMMNKQMGGNLIQPERLRKLRYFREMLGDVKDIDNFQGLSLSDVKDIPSQYKTIYTVSLIILKWLLISDSKGLENLFELKDTDQIKIIYQNFVANLLKRSLSTSKVVVNSQKSLRYFSNQNNNVYMGLRPDCVIDDKENKKLIIIDTKWYNSKSNETSNDNKIGIDSGEIGKSLLYGLAFKEQKDYREYEIYSLVLMAKNIYKTNSPQWIWHKEQILPGSDLKLSVIHHSMDRSFSEIKDDILGIAKDCLNGIVAKKFGYTLRELM